MTSEIIQKADEELAIEQSEGMSLSDFVEECVDHPNGVSQSARYILKAIEHYGTRTVVEEGEEKERYCFFDDPSEDGKNAILGNTDLLNSFVDELRRMASDEGELDRIIWFEGPTATGKSELKRCLINGVRGFARTEEGKRYTLKWSLNRFSGSQGMTYGDTNTVERDWYKSPVNVNPLTVLPNETREKLLEEVNNGLDYPVEVNGDLDPFSEDVYKMLEERENSFADVVSDDYLQVVPHEPDVGDGIGVLHSEDGGKPKEKMVGSWMQGAMENLVSRGKRNPQAFSYEGVISQGNGLMTIIEEASHHGELLQKLLNVCEEDMVKLDKKTKMDIDTLLIIVSNPDLKKELMEYKEAGSEDPYKALRRRLKHYGFKYLLNLSLEVQLLHRHLNDDAEVWVDEDGIHERVRDRLVVQDCEFAPNSLASAAMYEIITRFLYSSRVNPIKKALALETGEYDEDDVEVDDVKKSRDGSFGIPVTYTADTLTEMAQNNDVLIPTEVVEGMKEGISGSALFGDTSAYKDEAELAEMYALREMESDVLEAMVGDIEVTEEEFEEYVDSVFAWERDDEEEYDDYELMEFERRYFGMGEDDYGNNAIPETTVEAFREDTIMDSLGPFFWDNKDDTYQVGDLPVDESPAIEPLLSENDWDTVQRVFPEADVEQWRHPPSDTQTEELKEKTIRRMAEELGYSKESAEKTSAKVLDEKIKWENMQEKLEESSRWEEVIENGN